MDLRSIRYKKDGPPVSTTSRQKLDRLLDQLTVVAARKGAMMVKIKVPDVGEMYIGIGREVSVLSFSPEKPTKKNPRRVSNGYDRREGIVYFDYCGKRWGYERHRTIPVRKAREALRQFFQTGDVPDEITWEDLA